MRGASAGADGRPKPSPNDPPEDRRAPAFHLVSDALAIDVNQPANACHGFSPSQGPLILPEFGSAWPDLALRFRLAPGMIIR